MTVLLYFDHAPMAIKVERKERRKSPLLSAGSACYLFWKKCAPATLVHAALLQWSQVFEGTRSNRDISRELAETTARAKPHSTITRAAHCRACTQYFPPLHHVISAALAAISFMETQLFSLYPAARTRSRERTQSFRLCYWLISTMCSNEIVFKLSKLYW